MKFNLKSFYNFLYFLFLLPTIFFLLFWTVRLFYLCDSLLVTEVVGVVSLPVTWLLFRRMRKSGEYYKFPFVLAFVTTIILVAVSDLECARCSAPAANIRQTINNMRAQAEVYFYDNSDSYDGMCLDENVNELTDKVRSQQIVVAQKCVGPLLKLIKPDFSANSYFNCNDSTEAYAAEAYLPTTQNGTEFWCVDSTGFAGEIPNSMGDRLHCAEESEK